MRRLLAAALLPLTLLPSTAARAAVPVVFVDGRGFGHGVGMAQDGALAMGRAGASTTAILSQFYPGTSIGQASGTVRVVVHTTTGSELVVSFPGGGEVRDAPSGPQSAGFPLKVAAGEQVRLRVGGGTYTAEVLGGSAAGPPATASSSEPARPAVTAPASGAATAEESTTTTSPDPTLLPPSSTSTTSTTAAPPPPPSSTSTSSPSPAGSTSARRASSTRTLWAFAPAGSTVGIPARNRQYRDGLEAKAAGGPFRLVNHVAVETYLKGMGEVRDPRWPPAALRAQAIAARTYALRATQAGAELCDDQRCQVYLGAQAEYAAMNKAVGDSSGQVVMYSRRLASAVYSANGGGHSATPEEGFGTVGAEFPYLRAATYPSPDPAAWSTTIALSDVAARLGYAGTITEVRVGRTGPSGRALEVVLDGTAGTKAVSGLVFDANLGLRSTLFRLRVGTTDTAPPPPGQESLLQLPPDAVAVATSGPAGSSVVPLLPAAPSARARAEHGEATIGAAAGGAAAALVAGVGAAVTVVARRHHRHRWAHLRRRRSHALAWLRSRGVPGLAFRRAGRTDDD